MTRSVLPKLLVLLLIKAVILGCIAAFYLIDLAPDEAQYWTWSRALDWGYYSKPPAIAWQIWGTTALVGHHAFGVRIGAIILGFFLPLVVYRLALRANLTDRQAFWAAIVTAFSPIGIYLSFATTTDGGMILFLTLAIATLVVGCEKTEGPNYPLAGVWILLAALYKWTAFVFWPFVAFFWCFFPNFRKAPVIWGILISLCGLLPSLYWNFFHEWATFRHVASGVSSATEGNFLDFLGAQIGLLNPVFAALLLLGFYFFYKKPTRPLFICATFPAFVLLFLVIAFFKKMQPNWAAFLYPPGMILIAWVAYPNWRSWLHFGTWVSIVIVAFGLSLPALQMNNILPIPYKINPVRQSLGWRELDAILLKSGYNPNKDFLFGDKYQVASLLSFYGPEQKRAYFFNISDTRKNQFSYWPQMAEREVGKTGYFVVLEHTTPDKFDWYADHYEKRLSPYFEKVHYVGAYPLFSAGGEPVKYALIFKAVDYNGNTPPEINSY